MNLSEELHSTFEAEEFAARNQSDPVIKTAWFARSVQTGEYLSHSIETSWKRWLADRSVTYSIPNLRPGIPSPVAKP